MLILPPSVVSGLRRQALDSYPAECCGLLFAPKGTLAISRFEPLDNLADRLHALDPVEYPRTSRDYFAVNGAKMLKSVRAAEATGEHWACFYHSHIDCGAYFSAEDKRYWAPDGVPAYPEPIQLVLDCQADRMVEGRSFRWDGQDFAPFGHHLEFAGTR